MCMAGGVRAFWQGALGFLCSQAELIHSNSVFSQRNISFAKPPSRETARLPSRRIDGATFHHGAQFITTRNPRFAAGYPRIASAVRRPEMMEPSMDALLR